MPQMAPIWWTLLFILTLMVFMLSIIMNYFLMKTKINKNMKLDDMSEMNWKW